MTVFFLINLTGLLALLEKIEMNWRSTASVYAAAVNEAMTAYGDLEKSLAEETWQ